MKLKLLSRGISLALLPVFSGMAFADSDNNDVGTESIEKIVIVGQKFDTSIQESADSINVMTAEMMSNSGVITASDVLQHVPNVDGYDDQELSIRGINGFNVSGGGNSFLTSVYLDNAPLPYRAIRTGEIASMWDVSQVEIFRGPQSTLQGRNALAGAISIRTTDPSYETNGKARFTLGNYGQRGASAAFGSELFENQAAFRLSVDSQSIDGFNYNETRMENSDFREYDTYRAKLLVEPEAIPDLRVLISASHDESKVGSNVVNAADANGLRNVYHDAPIFNFTKSDIYTADVDYEISDQWSIKSITTFSSVDYGYEWDGDYSPEPLLRLYDDRNDETVSQEIRVIYQGVELKVAFGGFFSSVEVVDESVGGRTMSLDSLNVPALLVAPVEFGGAGLTAELAQQVMSIYAPVDPAVIEVDYDFYSKVESSALFADGSYSLTDSLNLLFGMRFDRETQRNSNNSVYSIGNSDAFPDPAVYAAFNPAFGVLISQLNGLLVGFAEEASNAQPVVKESFDALLPKLGVDYQWNDNISTALVYQQGYRSGGVGVNITTANTYTYDAEYADNIELSFRSTWLDGQLVFNANLFMLDWTDQQVSVQGTRGQFDVETQNVGSSTVSGFETELFWYPSKQWTVTAGIGYAKSEFDDFQYMNSGVEIDLSGRSFADAPEVTANIASSYQFDSGIFVNINANHASDSVAFVNPYISIFGYDGGQEPMNDARTIVNAQIGYDWGAARVWFNADNVLDESYIARVVDVNSNQLVIGAPKHFTINFEANF